MLSEVEASIIYTWKSNSKLETLKLKDWTFLKKITRKSISRILYFRRSACYLSTSYITAKLELITPRLSERAAPISITEKNRYTYHCTAKSLPGFTTAELYILSVALVLPSRVTDVIRFAALWCPDFPTLTEIRINKPTFSWLQRYKLVMSWKL